MTRGLAIGGLALLAPLALGCAPDAPDGAMLVATDARYRVLLHTDAAPSGDAPGTLRLHVETVNGWKIAPEAPARLDLEPHTDLEFEPATLRQEDATHIGEDAFEFVTRVRASRAGATTARGKLKFGVCEGDKEQCMIMRRELDLPIEVAAGS